MNRTMLAFLSIVFLMLTSCIGISMDIQMRKDGSGKLTITYTISNMAETIGRLDGNEKWHIIPAGRADWERTAARIPGVKLTSYSSRENTRAGLQNTVVTVSLEYTDAEALVNLIDASGAKVSISRENQSNKLSIILNEPIPGEINTDLLDLFRSVSAGYSVSLSFSADSNSTLKVTDGAGKEISASPVMQVVTSGKKVSFIIETAEVAAMKDGLGMEITW